MSKELFNQCQLVAEASFPEASNKFIKRITHQLSILAEAYKNDPAKLNQKVKELVEKSDKIYQIQRKTVIENQLKKVAIKEKFEAAKLAGRDPKEAAASIFVTAKKNFVGARDSISNMMKPLISEGNGILQQLTEIENVSDLFKGEYDLDIAKYLFETGNGLEVKGYPKHIQQMGDIMKRANAWVVTTLRQNGIYVGEIAGYIMRQTHDSVKISAVEFPVWAKAVVQHLDLEKTFGDIMKLPDFKVRAEAMLKEVYETVTTEGSSVGLNRFLKGRQLHFKSPEAFIAYNKEFGSFDTIYDAVKEAVRSTARQASLVKHLGTNHRDMVDYIKKNSDPELSNTIEDWYQTVLGADERVGNTPFAKKTTALRMLTNMAKLTNSAKAVLLDFVPAIMTIKGVTGKNFLETSFELVGTWLQSLDPKIRKEAARELAIDLELHNAVLAKNVAGTVVGGLEEMGSGLLASAHKWFFTINGMGPLTRMNKIAAGMTIARNLINVVGSKLDAIQTKIFQGYGIGDVQLAVYKLVKDTDFLAKNRVDRLTVDDLKQTFPDKTDAELIAIRDDAARKLLVMLNDLVEQAVPTPGKRERAAMGYSYLSPDTIRGQAVRSVGQFKMTSFKSLNDAVYQSSMYESRVPQASFIATRVIMGAASAYVIEQLYSYATSSDENPKEDEPLTPARVLEYAARGGGLGILGDFLFSRHNTIYRRMGNTAAGPLFSEIFKAGELMSMMADDQPLPREMAKFMIYNTPGLGLVFFKPFRDSLLSTTQDYMESILPRNYNRDRR